MVELSTAGQTCLNILVEGPRMRNFSGASWFPDGSMQYAPHSVTSDVAFGQKLDRVLVMLETQQKELDQVKEDTAGLKSDMAVLLK